MLPTPDDMLRELVALPSVSSTLPSLDMSNEGVIDRLGDWLDGLGFQCDKQAVDDAGKFNLIARRGSGTGGLALAGHTDTVPCDEALWQQDPFVLAVDDDKLTGLGATDMKGFFAVALAAANNTRSLELTAPLTLIATADEESTMNGARALLEQGAPLAQCAIVGEPTDLAPVHMHKGIMMEAIKIQGHSGHSSDPALGANALEAMHHVMAALLSLRSDWQAQFRDPAFAVPVPTLNLGCIHGGDNPNRICGHAELQFDIRLMPGMAIEPLREQIRQRLAPIAGQWNTDITLRHLMPGAEPFAGRQHSDLLSTAEAFSGQQRRSVAYATEAPFFQALGMDTIVMGPGSIDRAHQPGEFIPRVQMQAATDLLERLIRHYCTG